jgi:hypothetical protein
VYEFEGERPISMAPLPSMVVGGSVTTWRGMAVWETQGGGFVAVAPTKSSGLFSMGPGGPDLVSRVAWVRQIEPHTGDGWFSTEKATDHAAFGPGLAFRLAGGGYELKREDHQFMFPMASVDLTSGRETPMEIRIPYKGTIPMPTTNYTTFQLPDGVTAYSTRGPSEFAVTWLDVVGSSLRVFVAREGEESAECIEFRYSEIQAAVNATK